MKRAGQRWGIERARRMVRLRAVYRTAGAHNFHRAIRDGLTPPTARKADKALPKGRAVTSGPTHSADSAPEPQLLLASK